MHNTTTRSPREGRADARQHGDAHREFFIEVPIVAPISFFDAGGGSCAPPEGPPPSLLPIGFSFPIVK